MSVENSTLSAFMHLHDMDGEVIHQHISDFTLADFFDSIGIEFNSTCIMVDGFPYCNNGPDTLKMYVNGRRDYDFGKYEFNDLDKILVTFGHESEGVIKTQIDSVTDKSCIQSGKCPDRGSPGNESTCTTQGGCAS